MYSYRTARTVCLITLLILAGQISAVLGDTMTGITGGNAPVENRQPTLATRYMIALQGIFPDNAGSTPTQTFPPNRVQPFLCEIKAVPFDFVPSGWALCEGQALLINQNAALFSLIGTTYGGDGVSTFNLPDLRGRVPTGAGQGSGLPDYQLGDSVGTANPVLSVANLPGHIHTVGASNTGATGSGAPLDNRQPSLALHFLLAANGEIMIVPWSRQPTGWTRCEGRLLTVADHGYLFAHIGTTYGGDGVANFALPDLRGRVPIGDDGGNFWPLGLMYGSNDIVLSVADIPAHTHTISGGATGPTGGTGNNANNFQPSIVLRWVISFGGFYPVSGGAVSFPMLGEMRLIAGPAADGLPGSQWKLLNGVLYGIGANADLFSLIGTTYGGDGQSNFAVPDLRARVDAGASGSLAFSSIVGSPTLNISVAQLAAHAHWLLQLRISAIQHFGNGSAQISLIGTTGETCTVDRSDNLATWSTLGTVQLTGGTGMITDPNPTQIPRRFYKAYFP